MAQREISCGSYKLTRKDNNGLKCIEVETKRKLTSGEIQMARTMFKDSIDYDLVFICRGGIFHNMTGNARTLGNEITLPTKSYAQAAQFSQWGEHARPGTGTDVHDQHLRIRAFFRQRSFQVNYFARSRVQGR